ncbi:hypothetical protein ABT158_22750 [Nonomuraea sp. NPDC001636]|uniref:hypothetical protein n=1 Tax=Nonomuraea sp. NPDC001636 TaxID=3154391 RepID=UPI00331C6F9B
MTVRVLLADDQPLIRAGLRMVIDGTAGVVVAGRPGREPKPSSSPGSCAPTSS